MLGAISRAQSRFIADADSRIAFESLLKDLLTLTNSEYGFIGEVLYTAQNAPYLKTLALSNMAGDTLAPQELEFFDLNSVFGAMLLSGQPILVNHPEYAHLSNGLPDGYPPIKTFLGIPVHAHHRLIAMVGIANHPGGYDPSIIEFLTPLTTTVGQLLAARSNEFARRASEADKKRVEQMKNEFVSTVSHELRTPMTSITGALGLLKGGVLGELPDTVNELIDIAYANSRRLNDLINDLLDMENIAAGNMQFAMQVQPLRTLVEQALVANQTDSDPHQVQFSLTECIDGIHVRVDSRRLLQALSNYLTNAAKFSPPGGQVEILVQRAADHDVRIAVRDNGPGVPVEFRSRIFEKFSQADASDTRRQGGIGLGLAITRELIERMGGQVGFISEPGHGATFFIDLPIVNAGDEFQ